MNTVDRNDFNFDEWAALAHADSAAFERKRAELIAAALDAAPPHLQPRLRGLQFRIDLERQRAGTPLGAAVRLNSVMWSSFTELRVALAGLADGDAVTPRGPGATVIRFPQRP